MGMLCFLLMSNAALLRYHVLATLSEREQWRLTRGTVIGPWLCPAPTPLAAAGAGGGGGGTWDKFHVV